MDFMLVELLYNISLNPPEENFDPNNCKADVGKGMDVIPSLDFRVFLTCSHIL